MFRIHDNAGKEEEILPIEVRRYSLKSSPEGSGDRSWAGVLLSGIKTAASVGSIIIGIMELVA